MLLPPVFWCSLVSFSSTQANISTMRSSAMYGPGLRNFGSPSESVVDKLPLTDIACPSCAGSTLSDGTATVAFSATLPMLTRPSFFHNTTNEPKNSSAPISAPTNAFLMFPPQPVVVVSVNVSAMVMLPFFIDGSVCE